MSNRIIYADESQLELYLNNKDAHFKATKHDLEPALLRMFKRRFHFRHKNDPQCALRDFIPGHIYHLTHHAAERLVLVKNRKELRMIKKSLRTFARKYTVEILAHNIMGNHLHLIIRVHQNSQVSKFMQSFLSSAVQKINRKRRKEAYEENPDLLVEPSLLRFQGRFTAIHLLNTEYLRTSLIYVFTNAEKAGIPDHLGGRPLHNWEEFQAIYSTFDFLIPGGNTFAEEMQGIEQEYEARRKELVLTRGLCSSQRDLSSLRQRKEATVMDRVIWDLHLWMPGGIRRRRQYDPLRELW
jgi:REP element-mobilizing transposase RayT